LLGNYIRRILLFNYQFIAVAVVQVLSKNLAFALLFNIVLVLLLQVYFLALVFELIPDFLGQENPPPRVVLHLAHLVADKMFALLLIPDSLFTDQFLLSDFPFFLDSALQIHLSFSQFVKQFSHFFGLFL
jgi:hypothetical protein